MVLVRPSPAQVIRKITKLRFKLRMRESQRFFFLQLELKGHNLRHMNCQLIQEISVCARCGAFVNTGFWFVVLVELKRIVTFKNC